MAQPHLTLADQVERQTPELDRLCHDLRLREARLGSRHPDDSLHALEERAQRIAAAIVAPFRGHGARPVNPPIGRTPAGGYAW